MSPPALELTGVCKSFGGLSVVHEVSFSVAQGERVTLIGPNGAGKTTVFNLITGVYPVDAGRVTASDRRIDELPSRKRIQAGIARTFQNIRLVPELDVIDNVILGEQSVCKGLRPYLAPIRWLRNSGARAQARSVLAEIDLQRFDRQKAGGLPYGIRKQIEIARALMAGPSILLLDEPAAGLNAEEAAELSRVLLKLSDAGLTLLIIEHDMHFVDQLCDHTIVLNFGRKIAEGTLAEIRRDPVVREAYIGRAEH